MQGYSYFKYEVIFNFYCILQLKRSTRGCWTLHRVITLCRLNECHTRLIDTDLKQQENDVDEGMTQRDASTKTRVHGRTVARGTSYTLLRVLFQPQPFTFSYISRLFLRFQFFLALK